MFMEETMIFTVECKTLCPLSKSINLVVVLTTSTFYIIESDRPHTPLMYYIATN